MPVISATLTISGRVSICGVHARTAVALADEAFAMERDLDDGQAGDPDLTRHRALVLGSITASAFLMEAAINSFFADCADDRPPRGVEPSVVAAAKAAWPSMKYSPKVFKKYDDALALAGAKAMSGDHRRGAADLVRMMRNALAHGIPVSVVLVNTDPEEEIDEEELQRRMRTRCRENPWRATEGQPFFPLRMASFDAARWALATVVQHADETFSRLRCTTPPYEAERAGIDRVVGLAAPRATVRH